jgi:hypothetical protein
MATRHIIVAVTALGVGGAGAVLYWIAQGISPDDYHTDPIEAHLDEDLFGGASAIKNMPTFKPFLYLHEPDRGSGFKLYVLIPLPAGTTIASPTFDTSVRGTCKVKYVATGGDPRAYAAGLFNQTLIPVQANVSTVIVECVVQGLSTHTSTVGTGDSDHEDPISGGPATPYMSGMTTDGLMLYTGGMGCNTTVEFSSGPVTGSVDKTPVFQPFDPGAPDFTLFKVGKREVKGVR